MFSALQLHLFWRLQMLSIQWISWKKMSFGKELSMLFEKVEFLE